MIVKIITGTVIITGFVLWFFVVLWAVRNYKAASKREREEEDKDINHKQNIL